MTDKGSIVGNPGSCHGNRAKWKVGKPTRLRHLHLTLQTWGATEGLRGESDTKLGSRYIKSQRLVGKGDKGIGN
jgi:hypothetical protein